MWITNSSTGVVFRIIIIIIITVVVFVVTLIIIIVYTMDYRHYQYIAVEYNTIHSDYTIRKEER